jgi:hypothetical protein
MRPSRAITAIVLLALAPAATGCHRYVPVETGSARPEPGQQVRAHLNAPDRVRLTHVTAEDVVQINGELVEWDDGRVVLSAFWLKSSSGIEHRAVGETVALREDEIQTLEAKQVSVVLSAAVVVGAVAALVLIGRQFTGTGGGEDTEPPPPDVRRGSHN